MQVQNPLYWQDSSLSKLKIHYSQHNADCYTHFGCCTNNTLATELSGFLQMPLVILDEDGKKGADVRYP